MKTLDFAQLQAKALRLLAWREYCRAELKLKLKNYAQNNSDLNKLLDELEQNNYLSDQRFLEGYIRVRSESGRGMRAIMMELQQKGIAAKDAQIAVKNAPVNWQQNLRQIWQHKFGFLPKNAAEYAKQTRFLLSRGFDYADIKNILNGKFND